MYMRQLNAWETTRCQSKEARRDTASFPVPNLARVVSNRTSWEIMQLRWCKMYLGSRDVRQCSEGVARGSQEVEIESKCEIVWFFNTKLGESGFDLNFMRNHAIQMMQNVFGIRRRQAMQRRCCKGMVGSWKWIEMRNRVVFQYQTWREWFRLELHEKSCNSDGAKCVWYLNVVRQSAMVFHKKYWITTVLICTEKMDTQ